MSPVYNYHHLDEESGARCPGGAEFDFTQVAGDFPLSRCPYCGGDIERGVAAAVRTRPFEEKYLDRRDPSVFPDPKKLKN